MFLALGETITAAQELTSWTEHYLKNKDVMLKSIASITSNENNWTFVVQKTDGTQQVVLVDPLFENVAVFVTRLQQDTNTVLVVLNTHKNLDRLIEHWQALSQFPKLVVIFANPDSAGEHRWLIFPHTHDKIAARKALRKGLESMFAMVDEYKEES